MRTSDHRRRKALKEVRVALKRSREREWALLDKVERNQKIVDELAKQSLRVSIERVPWEDKVTACVQVTRESLCVWRLVPRALVESMADNLAEHLIKSGAL